MILNISIILFTFALILYPKLEDWRDKRYSSIYAGIKERGRILILIAIILLTLQIIQACKNHEQQKEITSLTENLKIAIENEKPNFQLTKKKIKWINNKSGNPVIQCCFENKGCRSGQANLIHINFYYVLNNEIRYHLAAIDNTDIYVNLVNDKIESEECCLEVNYESKEFPEVMIEIYVEYSDPITKQNYKTMELLYWLKDLNSDDFILGLTEKQKNSLNKYKTIKGMPMYNIR